MKTLWPKSKHTGILRKKVVIVIRDFKNENCRFTLILAFSWNNTYFWEMRLIENWNKAHARRIMLMPLKQRTKKEPSAVRRSVASISMTPDRMIYFKLEER